MMIDDIFPIRCSLLLDLLDKYMSNIILDFPPLNYGISKTASPFCNLTSESSSWALNTSSILKLDLGTVHTKDALSWVELSWVESSLKKYCWMDLISRNPRWRSSWVHRLLHSELPGCAWFENETPRSGLSIWPVWPQSNLKGTPGSCSPFWLWKVCQVNRDQESWH